MNAKVNPSSGAHIQRPQEEAKEAIGALEAKFRSDISQKIEMTATEYLATLPATPVSETIAPTIVERRSHFNLPLSVRESGDANEFTLLDSRGHWVAMIRHNGEPLAEVVKANVEFINRACNSHDDLVTVLKSVKRLDDMLMAIENEASMQIKCAMQDEHDEALPALMRDVAAVLAKVGAL